MRTKSERAGFLFNAHALILLFAVAAAAELSLADRFEAVHAACGALAEAGGLDEIAAEDCARLVRARNERRTAVLESLLEELESRLSLEVKFFEPIVLELGPRTPALHPSVRILDARRDVVVVGTDTFDEVSHYMSYSDETAPILFSVRPHDTPSAVPLQSPPSGWNEYKDIVFRLDNAVRHLGRDARIILPGIDVRRPDWRIWLWCAATFFPDHPRFLDGIPADRDLRSMLPGNANFGDQWYFRLANRPDSPLTASALLKIAHRLSFLGIPSLGFVLAERFPGDDLLLPAFVGLGNEIEINGFRGGEVVLLRNGNRVLVGNTGASVVQLRLERSDAPREEFDVRLVFLRDNGETHVIERSGRLPYSVPILPGGVTFADLGG